MKQARGRRWIVESSEEEEEEITVFSGHGRDRGYCQQSNQDDEEVKEVEDVEQSSESSSTEANDPGDSDFEGSDSSLDAGSD